MELSFLPLKTVGQNLFRWLPSSCCSLQGLVGRVNGKWHAFYEIGHAYAHLLFDYQRPAPLFLRVNKLVILCNMNKGGWGEYSR